MPGRRSQPGRRSAAPRRAPRMRGWSHLFSVGCRRTQWSAGRALCGCPAAERAVGGAAAAQRSRRASLVGRGPAGQGRVAAPRQAHRGGPDGGGCEGGRHLQNGRHHKAGGDAVDGGDAPRQTDLRQVRRVQEGEQAGWGRAALVAPQERPQLAAALPLRRPAQRRAWLPALKSGGRGVQQARSSSRCRPCGRGRAGAGVGAWRVDGPRTAPPRPVPTPTLTLGGPVGRTNHCLPSCSVTSVPSTVVLSPGSCGGSTCVVLWRLRHRGGAGSVGGSSCRAARTHACAGRPPHLGGGCRCLGLGVGFFAGGGGFCTRGGGGRVWGVRKQPAGGAGGGRQRDRGGPSGPAPQPCARSARAGPLLLPDAQLRPCPLPQRKATHIAPVPPPLGPALSAPAWRRRAHPAAPAVCDLTLRRAADTFPPGAAPCALPSSRQQHASQSRGRMPALAVAHVVGAGQLVAERGGVQAGSPGPEGAVPPVPHSSAVTSSCRRPAASLLGFSTPAGLTTRTRRSQHSWGTTRVGPGHAERVRD